MIAVTGASGQLGQLVITHLLKKAEAKNIVALVRDSDKAKHFEALNIEVREADYNKADTLISSLKGIDTLLLISSSDVGNRTVQHKNVIDAAKQVGVQLLAYTSILNADNSPLSLAKEHIDTERYLKEKNIPHVLLRNGWYTENYLAGIPAAIANGGYIGCAKDGRISSSAREDYAEAAAVVLTSETNQAGKVYELSGDESYTLEELCDIITEETGKTIPYIDMKEREFADTLEKAGFPRPLAEMLADSDTGASKGGLLDESHVLSDLIGHQTKPLRQMVKASL